MLGKRFLFGVVSVICITVTACILKLEGDIIVKLYGLITGLYIAGQTITDAKNGGSK